MSRAQSSSEPIDDVLTKQYGVLMPFVATLGLGFVRADRDEVRGRIEWSPDKCTTAGMLHGGVLMAVADTLGAVCAFHNLPDGAGGTTTIESKTNFLRGVRAGVVEGVSRPLHAGRTTIVVDTELRDSDGKLVARVTQTQAVLGT